MGYNRWHPAQSSELTSSYFYHVQRGSVSRRFTCPSFPVSQHFLRTVGAVHGTLMLVHPVFAAPLQQNHQTSNYVFTIPAHHVIQPFLNHMDYLKFYLRRNPLFAIRGRRVFTISLQRFREDQGYHFYYALVLIVVPYAGCVGGSCPISGTTHFAMRRAGCA